MSHTKRKLCNQMTGEYNKGQDEMLDADYQYEQWLEEQKQKKKRRLKKFKK